MDLNDLIQKCASENGAEQDKAVKIPNGHPPLSSKRSVYLRSPLSLTNLAMEVVLKNRDFYENEYENFKGFELLAPFVLQTLIEYINARIDRFLTAKFTKMLLNENTHFACIANVDEKHREEVYKYMIRHCGPRLKIIENLWLDSNLKVSVCDLLKFNNLVKLELLQLECDDEILKTISISFPELRSLAVTFREDDVSEEGLAFLRNLEVLEKLAYRVDENDHTDYLRMLQRLMKDFELNWEIKTFYVSGIRRKVSVEEDNRSSSSDKKPVAGRIGSYIKKKFVRAFSKEGGM